jgi:hypothetical protein
VAEAQVIAERRPQWRVACACGFEREASSAWAATAIARQHAQLLLDSPGSDHEIIVEEPPVD